MSAPHRLVLVDDHAMVREALAALLTESGPFEIVAQAGARHAAVAAIREHRPDLVVLDYSIPEGGALGVLEDLAREGLVTRVLVLTVHELPHYAVQVLEAGAAGFMVKSSPVEELIAALERLIQGEIYVTPGLASAVFRHTFQARRREGGLGSLSAREFELLRALARGLTLTEASETLGISTSTASTYRSRMLKKLGLRSTGELIRYAVEQGVVV